MGVPEGLITGIHPQPPNHGLCQERQGPSELLRVGLVRASLFVYMKQELPFHLLLGRTAVAPDSVEGELFVDAGAGALAPGARASPTWDPSQSQLSGENQFLDTR